MIVIPKYSAALASWVISEADKAGAKGRRMLYSLVDNDIYYIQHRGLCAYSDSIYCNLIEYENQRIFEAAGAALEKKLCRQIDDDTGTILKTTGCTVEKARMDGRKKVVYHYREFADSDGNRWYTRSDLLKPLDIFNKSIQYIDTVYHMIDGLIYARNVGQIIGVFGVASSI